MKNNMKASTLTNALDCERAIRDQPVNCKGLNITLRSDPRSVGSQETIVSGCEPNVVAAARVQVYPPTLQHRLGQTTATTDGTI